MATKWSKQISAALLYVALPFALLEISALIVGHSTRMFDWRHSHLLKITESGRSYEDFTNSPSYSALTGWQTPANTFDKSSKNCLGQQFFTNHLDDGRRKSLADESGVEAQLAVFGASFVYGHEISDADTISSQLHKRFSIPAYNYAVNGFGPVQTLLRIKEKMTRRPEIKLVVFGITYSGIQRVVNSFRPVYSQRSRIIFGLKPFVKDRKIVAVPIIKDDAAFFRYINSAFSNDYWWRPVAKFPYTFSLAKARFTEQSKRRLGSLIRRLQGRPYRWMHYDYADEHLTGNLEFVIREFDEWAREANKDALVLFIPEKTADLSSPRKFVEELVKKVKVDIRFVQGAPDEWEKYHLKPKDKCHPSPFGAWMIAREIASWVSSKDNVAEPNSLNRSMAQPARQ